MLNYPWNMHKEYYNDNLQNTLRRLFHVIWRFNKSWLIDLIYFDIWTLYTLVVNLLFRPFQRCTDSTLSFFLHCVNMPHPKVIYAFGNCFWNLGRIDGKLGISCSLSAWHCNGFLMGCWAWLNALLDPAAVWWGMRFRFLAVWLRLQKKWKRKTKKSMSVIGVLPKLRSPSALPSHVTWLMLCLGLASKRPRCRAPGRLTGISGGLGGWVGVGSDVQFDHRLISSLDFSNDRPHRGWHRAGGLYFYSNPSRTQSLCTAGIFVKRNPVSGRLYFLIVATSWLMNHSLLPLFFCSFVLDSFIVKKMLSALSAPIKACWKKAHSLFFCVYVCFFHSAGLVLGQPANHRYQTWRKLNGL